MQPEVLRELRHIARKAYSDGREVVVVESLAPYLEHCPEDVFAWLMYGDALRVIGRFDDAIRALTKAECLAKPARRPLIQGRLALAFQGKGELLKAEESFCRATEHASAPMIGWLFVLRGANLAKLGYFEEAKACHLQALELTSHPDEVLLNIGYVLRAQRRYAEAGDAFSQANTMSKGCPEATAAIRSMEGLEEVQSRVFRAIDDAASDDGP